jgi:hypothetical protein
MRRNMNRINSLKAISLLFLVIISQNLFAQNEDSSALKISNFTAAVTIQSKGISTIPNLTLGKPAIIFDMKLGRKLTFEPQFRFAIDGKPWAMVFWWRYYETISDKFKVTYSTNYSFSYKSIKSYTLSGTSQEMIRTTRYLVGAVEPNYRISKYFGVGMYFFYNYGIESFITKNTYMISFRPTFSNIPISKNVVAMVAPEIYSLIMDRNNGVFFNSRFLISKKNFPLAISGLINKPMKSSIPSEYDFLWNVGLSYTFNKKFVEAL